MNITNIPHECFASLLLVGRWVNIKGIDDSPALVVGQDVLQDSTGAPIDEVKLRLFWPKSGQTSSICLSRVATVGAALRVPKAVRR